MNTTTCPTGGPATGERPLRSAAEALGKQETDAAVCGPYEGGNNWMLSSSTVLQTELGCALNVGVAGFILKDATFDDFVGTIRSVARGERVLPVPMTGTLFSQIARGDHHMIGFHDHVRVRRIPLDEVEALCDPDVAFMNVNTPAERDRAERIAAESSHAG